MGGFGSGRSGWRSKCEDLCSIDVRAWAQAGLLGQTRRFLWHWKSSRGSTFAVQVSATQDKATLEYRRCDEAIRLEVPLTSTPCYFGGSRFWFLCPRIDCRKRAAMLYLKGLYFACRRCHKLAYASQAQSELGRVITQAGKIRSTLGGRAGSAYPFPPGPKRMRLRTYEKLRNRCQSYEQQLDFAEATLLTRITNMVSD
jgi:hypothetical protein